MSRSNGKRPDCASSLLGARLRVVRACDAVRAEAAANEGFDCDAITRLHAPARRGDVAD
jgi:hypothetical protein